MKFLINHGDKKTLATKKSLIIATLNGRIVMVNQGQLYLIILSCDHEKG